MECGCGYFSFLTYAASGYSRVTVRRHTGSGPENVGSRLCVDQQVQKPAGAGRVAEMCSSGRCFKPFS